MTSADDRALLPTPEQLAELLRLVAESRDKQAYAALFRYYAPRLKSFLIRQGYSDAECEDLIQESMLSLWRKAEKFDPAKAGVSTWLFTIARNLGIDRRRRDKTGTRAPLVEAEEEADTDPSAEHILITRESEVQIRAALLRLPAEQAAVIRMSFFGENPQAEIAKVLGIPLGTVKSRVRLALQRLRQMMDESQ